MSELTNHTGGGLYEDESEESVYVDASDSSSSVDAGSNIESTSMGEWDFDIGIVAETVVIEDAAVVAAVDAVDHQA